MNAPTTITVEHFIAAGRQGLACGHVVEKGDVITDLRFGAADDVTARVVGMCAACFAAVGRLGAPR